MKEAEEAAKTEAARHLRETIVWARYPKLATIFKERPPVNVYWHELAELIRDLRSS